MKIYERLLKVRKSQQKTQPPFAEELGVSLATYKNYERGITELPLSIAVIICTNFKISPSWLMLGVGNMIEINTLEIIEKSVLDIRKIISEYGLITTPTQEAKIVKYVVEERFDGVEMNSKKIIRLIEIME